MKGHHVGTIACFGIAAACAAGYVGFGVAPVSYGAAVGGGQATGANAAGVAGLLSFVGGIWAMLKGGGADGVLKKITDLGGVLSGPQTAETITAEVALVALATICVKRSDTDNLTKVGDLAKAMLATKT